MAEYDLKTSVKVVPAINPVSSSAGANGISIDTKGYESVTFNVQTGTMTSGTINFGIEHADDNGAGSPGTFAAAAADDIIGASPSFNQAASGANAAASVGYRGKKQWVRLVSSGTFSTVLHSATCSLGHPKVVPVV